LGIGFGREGSRKEESGRDQSEEAWGQVCRKGGSNSLGSSIPRGKRKRGILVRIKFKFLEKDKHISHMTLNVGAVMRAKWLRKPYPVKQKKEINHGIKED
jgi:hypothetical protein